MPPDGMGKRRDTISLSKLLYHASNLGHPNVSLHAHYTDTKIIGPVVSFVLWKNIIASLNMVILYYYSYTRLFHINFNSKPILAKS